MLNKVVNIDLNMFDNVQGHVFTLDADMRFCSGNDHHAEYWNLGSTKDVVGWSHAELINRTNIFVDFAKFIQDDLRVFHSGNPLLNVIDPPCVQENGELQFFRANVLPLQNKYGETIGVIGITQDVSDEIQIEYTDRLNYIIKYDARCQSLTPREQQVLSHYVVGKSCKEIAKIYGLSPRTVEGYTDKIKTKLRVGSKAELIASLL